MKLFEGNTPGYNEDYLDFCSVISKVGENFIENMQKLHCAFIILWYGFALF